MEVPSTFSSVEEECCYWRDKSKRYFREKLDCQQELEDFTEESRQLETELEATIEQNEKSLKDLRSALNQQQLENDSIRKRLLQYESENHKLDHQYKTLKTDHDHLRIYIRDLEQKNDDLERANRIVTESVSGFEAMLNQAYEKNALLEIEVDEKEVLQVKLQRTLDEARDLKQELTVKQRPASCTIQRPTSSITETQNYDNILLNNHVNNHQILTTPNSALDSISSIKERNGNSNSMIPSSKSAALNLVAELLRKVNNMEAKLKACKPSPKTKLTDKYM